MLIHFLEEGSHDVAEKHFTFESIFPLILDSLPKRWKFPLEDIIEEFEYS